MKAKSGDGGHEKVIERPISGESDGISDKNEWEELKTDMEA